MRPRFRRFPALIRSKRRRKSSALTWRVLRRQRGRVGDDVTLIRHLYDLAALARTVKAAPSFAALALQAAATDVGRGGEATAASDPVTLFATMIERLRSDRLWAVEYDNFVRQVSFAQPHERISFEQALAAVITLVDSLDAG